MHSAARLIEKSGWGSCFEFALQQGVSANSSPKFTKLAMAKGDSATSHHYFRREEQHVLTNINYSAGLTV